MGTTLTNTTALFLFVLFIVCVVRFVGQNEKNAAGWLGNILQRSARSYLLRGILVVGAAAGLGSHILVGYIGPGDIFQDFVGAKEFAAGRSLNPTTTMPERVDYWLRQDPPTLPAFLQLPALRALQADSVNTGLRQLFVQAHPPFHVLMLAPIVRICGGIQRLYVVMTLINLAAYLGLLYILWRTLPDILRWTGAGGLLLLLAMDWQPLLANLRQGQIGIIVALLVTAGWYALTRKHCYVAGILIGLASLIKMFPALLLVWLLFRNKRAFAAALVTILGAAVSLYWWLGATVFTDYLSAARRVVEIFGRGRNNFSLSSLVSYMIDGPLHQSMWGSVVSWAACAALLGYSVLVLLRKSQPLGKQLAVEFCTFAVLACVLSPTCETFYNPLLLFPIAVAVSVVPPTHVLRHAIIMLAILLPLSLPEQVVWKSTLLLTPVVGDRIAWFLCSFPTFAILGLWWRLISAQSVSPVELTSPNLASVTGSNTQIR